jgi:drug/metabolite transporter (DMT)-like permease
MWWRARAADSRPLRARLIAFAAGVGLGLDTIFWQTAIGHIGAGLATLLVNTQVIFVAIFAWLALRERPAKAVLVAIPVVLFGVGLVSGIGQEDAFGSNPIKGALLALVAAAFYAGFILGIRLSNVSRAPAVGPLLDATLGAVTTALIAGVATTGIEFDLSWPRLGWLLALAIGPQVLGWSLITFALPRLPVVETATIILIQPALTLLWGALIFTERPSGLQIAGAALVLSGVAAVAVARARLGDPVAVVTD